MSPIETANEYAEELSELTGVRFVILPKDMEDIAKLSLTQNYKGSPAVIIYVYEHVLGSAFNGGWEPTKKEIGKLLDSGEYRKMRSKYRDLTDLPVQSQVDEIASYVANVMSEYDVSYEIKPADKAKLLFRVHANYPKKLIEIYVRRYMFTDSEYFLGNISRFKSLLPPDIAKVMREFEQVVSVSNEIKQLTTKDEIERRTWEVARTVGVDNLLSKIKWQYSKEWSGLQRGSTIYFNPSILMMPIETADVVIYHELAHLIHGNHSKDFWDLLLNWMPNYRSMEKEFDRIAHAYDLAGVSADL